MNKNEKFSKEIEIIIKKQILEQKNAIKEIKNATETINSGMDQSEERIC